MVSSESTVPRMSAPVAQTTGTTSAPNPRARGPAGSEPRSDDSRNISQRLGVMEAAVLQMEKTIDMRFEQLLQARQAPGGLGSASGSEHQQNQVSDNSRLPGSTDSSQVADNFRLGRGGFSPRSSHSLPLEPVSNTSFEVGAAPPSIRPILVNPAPSQRSRSESTSSQERSVSFEDEVQHIPNGALVGAGEVSVFFTSIVSLCCSGWYQDGVQ